MIIHFMKEDSLASLKTNVKSNINLYANETNQWIYDFLDGEDPFVEYKSQIEDFAFAESEPGVQDTGKVDTENAIRLYSAMRNLSDTQATDERLWAGLCHGDFWNYLHDRWYSKDGRSSKVSQESILWRYFFNSKSGGKRGLFRNTLSRLWWIARLTYDDSRKDPFELTKYWTEDFSTKSLIIFSSNYMGNPTITRGLVSALIELDHAGYSYGERKRDVYYAASRYLNLYGGTHILDYFSEEEIKEKVLKYMLSLVDKVPDNSIINMEQENGDNHIDNDSLKDESLISDNYNGYSGKSAKIDDIETLKDDSSTEQQHDDQLKSEKLNETFQQKNDDFIPFDLFNDFMSDEDLDDISIEHTDSSDSENSEILNNVSENETQSGEEEQSMLRIDDKSLYESLLSYGFECIDNRSTSSILWVIYESEKKELFENILCGYGMIYKREKRGSLATGNRPAWRIMYEEEN